MKTNLLRTLALSIVLCLVSNVSRAQAPAIEWHKCLGGTGRDGASTIIQTTDGGYTVAGWTESNDSDVTGNHGQVDYWIVKLGSTGVKQWAKTYGGSGDDYPHSIIQTTDGGYAVAGNSRSDDGDVTGLHGNDDCWIVKLSSTGVKQWAYTYGGSGSDAAFSIIQTTDGGYALAGITYSNDGDVTGLHGYVDYLIVKLSSTGVKQWAYTYGGSGADAAYSVIQTTDGGYALAGNTQSNDGDVTGLHGYNDCWIVKLSNTGVKQWAYTYGGSGYNYAKTIIQTTDGGYAVAGQTDANDGDVTGNHGSIDMWIVKLSSTGVKQWAYCYGGSNGDIANSFIQTTDGGYAVAGYSTSNDSDVTANHGSTDCWIVKLSSTGVKQWTQTYGGSASDGASSIVQTTDGGYALAGNTYSNDGDVTGFHGGQGDYWIVKLSATTDIDETTNDMVFSIYPNPSNNSVTVSIDESMIGSNLTITDITGRKVAVVSAVNSVIRIPTSAFANGVYFVTLENENGRVTKKLLKQ